MNAVIEFDKDWAKALLDAADNNFDGGSWNRGRAYAFEGRVRTLHCPDKTTITSTVQGSHLYQCSIAIEDDGDHKSASTECSCPIGGDCKHVVATIITMFAKAVERNSLFEIRLKYTVKRLSSRRTLETMRPRMTEEFESLLKPLSGSTSQTASAPANVYPISMTVKSSQVKPAPKPWWRELIHAETEYHRREAVGKGLRLRIPRGMGFWGVGEFMSGSGDIGNPIVFLERFENATERFARDIRASLSPLPAELKEFLGSSEAVELKKEFNHRQVENAFRRWVCEPSSRGEGLKSSLNIEWSVNAAKSDLRFPRLAFKALLSSTTLKRSPRRRHELERLGNEVETGKRCLPDNEERLLNWLLSRPDITSCVSGNSHDETVFYVMDAISWVSTWNGSDMIRWENGSGPVRLVMNPARLKFAMADGDLRPLIEVDSGNGAPVETPLSEADIVTDYPITRKYLYGSEIHKLYVRMNGALRVLDALDVKPDVLGVIRLHQKIPLEVLRRNGIGELLIDKLIQNKTRIPPELITMVPVRPVAEFRLEKGNEISLSAYAVSPEGHVFRWRPGGLWERHAGKVTENPETAEIADPGVESAETAELGKPEVSATSLRFFPREEDTAPLQEWLSKLLPIRFSTSSLEDGATAFSWKVKSADYPELLRLWAERPKNVKYFGSKSFRDLVTVSRLPRFSVKVEPSGTDWLWVSVEMEDEMEAVSPQEIRRLLKESENGLLPISGGRVYQREDMENYLERVRALSEAGIDCLGGKQRLHTFQLAGEGAKELVRLSGHDSAFAEIAERARKMAESFKGIPRAKVDKRVAGVLRPYQRDGADFIAWAAKTFGGAILSDDMGLGKTVQLLAALSAVRMKKDLPSLVVCPASVAHNWRREAEKFAPWLKTVVIEAGSGRKALLAKAGDYDIVIKNYHLTRMEAETLAARQWLAVVVDEAQMIKNPGAEITKAVKSLSAKYRFALTGTPIENRLTDLWSITDFAVSGYLGTLATFDERTKRGDEAMSNVTLRGRLRPVLIRRMKSDVETDLPPRIEERRDCEMAPGQKKIYLAELKKSRMMMEAMKGSGSEGQQRIMILAALTRLRQICCDPGLVGQKGVASGKTEEFFALAEPLLESGHKILVFSQFVRMLETLKGELAKKKIKTYLLTGKTGKRQELVESFEKDPDPSIFLISLKAGGVGLNLVSASHVVIFDPWWNPAVEAQAIDRTHRIGQDKTVMAFRLVASGTIEEKIMELQEKKKELVRDVLDEGDFNMRLTRKDMEFLLSGGVEE